MFDSSGRQLQQTGVYFTPYNVHDWQAIRLVVTPLSTKTYYLKVSNLVRVVDPLKVMLHTPTSLRLWFADNSYFTRWLFLGLAIVASGLLIMSLFAFTQYHFTRDKVFLYYAIFCFIAGFFVVWNMNFRLGLGLPLQMRSTSRNFTFIMAFFYVLFLAKFVNLATYAPKTWRVMKVFLLVFVAQESLVGYEYFYGLVFHSNWPYLRQDVTFLLSGIILFTSVLRSKSPYKVYLLAGISSVWAIAFLSMFLDVRVAKGNPSLLVFINYIPFFFGLGMLLENFFFLIALAYRNRLVEIEKNKMQVRYAEQLERQLEFRTKEVQAQSKILEEQHIRQLESNFEQKIAETEMTALRAQMNPHFIFNCLNSIKLYTLENDVFTASEYLTKFSRLIRLVLENSRSEKVTLENELETLELDIAMEVMRFKNKVKYHITIDETIDYQYIEIPPLLLQPYVENAIWHGLMHKEEGGTVTITVETQNNATLLRVIITDDGVGRAASNELKSKSATKNKSFGLKMTSERIELINQLYKSKTQVQIDDLVNAEGHAAGTRVIVKIPI
ncbi:histidine kinase [Runella sp.]|uniref:histidine kinase n=1 Tax=Runella sp. TaxID=1960881 RepID=UPI00301B0005